MLAAYHSFFSKCATCGRLPNFVVETPAGKQYYCAESFEYKRSYFEWLKENQEGTYSAL